MEEPPPGRRVECHGFWLRTGQNESKPINTHFPQLLDTAYRMERFQLKSKQHSEFLDRSIKVEVKKKHISCGWNFSCFAAHLMERDLF
jgi:hypothetical protein